MRGFGHPSSTVQVIPLSLSCTLETVLATVHCFRAPVALRVLANQQRFPQED